MQLLKECFDTVVSAPDGVSKVREMILAFAVQGKLVPQEPDDQHAEKLLEEIKDRKETLIKQGKIKNNRLLQKTKLLELSYDLPDGWAWVRLGDISEYIQRGKGPKYADDSEIPVISQKCIQWTGFNRDVVRFIDPSTLDKYQDERFIRTGDLLWNSTGTGTIGRVNLYKDELYEFERVVADSHVTVVRLIGVCNDYVLNFLMSPSIQSVIEENASGTTNQIELNTSHVVNQLVPLPPLAEQHRIVAKIDQLMVRCDELEKPREERDRLKITVHRAACDRLLTAPDTATFTKSWQFITQNFSELYSVKENVGELRKAILQLAVMGRLVPQKPSDSPADELLEKIQAEKQRLIAKGQIRKQKALSKLSHNKAALNMPVGWVYTRMDELFVVTGGIQKTPKRKPLNNHYPYLGVSNVQRGYLDLSNVKRFELFEDELDKQMLKHGDLMVVEGNGNPNEVGRCAIWQGEIENCVHQNHLIKCRPLHRELSNYILMFLNSPLGIGEMRQLAVTTSGLYNLSVSKIRGVRLLLPPLQEQHRIVTKVDQLMTLCDTLEQQIDATTQKQTALLNATLANI